MTSFGWIADSKSVCWKMPTIRRHSHVKREGQWKNAKWARRPIHEKRVEYEAGPMYVHVSSVLGTC